MRIRQIGSGLVAVAVVLVMTVSPALAQEQEGQEGLTKAQQLTEEGRTLLQQEKPQEALEVLDRAIEADPSWQFAHFFRGYAYGYLERHEDALASFQRALELAPEWADAAHMSAVAAFQTGDVEMAWDYAVRAHQSGGDISQLRQMMANTEQPDDLEERLSAPRIFVDNIDVEGLLARNENPFGRAVDTGVGTASDVTNQEQEQGGVQSRNTTTSKATGTGNRILAESQADLNTLLRKTREALGNSPSFGLVPRREMSSYTLIFEIDDMGEDNPRFVKGYLKLYDTRTGEEAYKRVMELRNINSVGDVNSDIERYVDYLEEWIAEQSR